MNAHRIIQLFLEAFGVCAIFDAVLILAMIVGHKWAEIRMVRMVRRLQ